MDGLTKQLVKFDRFAIWSRGGLKACKKKVRFVGAHLRHKLFQKNVFLAPASPGAFFYWETTAKILKNIEKPKPSPGQSLKNANFIITPFLVKHEGRFCFLAKRCREGLVLA